MGRKEVLRSECEAHGFTVDWYSPGDGVTRYRFFVAEDTRNDYFSAHGDFTALGWKEALAYATGRTHGYARKLAVRQSRILSTEGKRHEQLR